MSDAVKLPLATIADLLAIPEAHRRHEVIDGSLIEKEAASGRHGGAQARLSRTLGPTIVGPAVVGQEAGGSPPRSRSCSRTPRSFDRMSPAGVANVSPSSQRKSRSWCVLDLIKKKRVYHRHQVGHYWTIDPVEETLDVHRWNPDGYVEILIAKRTETVRADPFEAIERRVGVLFGDDPDE